MKKLILAVLITLIPTMLFADEIGLRMGAVEFNNPDVYGVRNTLVYGTELLFKDNWYDMDLRLDAEFANAGYRVASVMLSGKYNFPIEQLWPYIGAGFGLVLLNSSPQKHALGTLIYFGIEPKMTENVTFFYELRFVDAKSQGFDLGSTTFNGGVRWLLK